MEFRDFVRRAAEKTRFPNREEITESLLDNQFLWHQVHFFREDGRVAVAVVLSNVDDDAMKMLAESWGADEVVVDGNILTAFFWEAGG